MKYHNKFINNSLKLLLFFTLQGSYKKFRNFDLYSLYRNTTEDEEFIEDERNKIRDRNTVLPHDELTINAY